MPAEVWAALPVLLVLICLSAFFSGSEAAFFSLTMAQRSSLAKQGGLGLVAQTLLNRPERLLTGILFWNLAINISFFSVASRVSLAVDSSDGDSHSLAAIITVGALVCIVALGEFLPKSIAVVQPLLIVKYTAIPLALAIRVLDSFLPTIKVVNEASRRMLWPGLKPEAYLELSDLDRAVELSTEDASLFEQESQVLRNIIQLGEIRVEEWMRPRTEYRTFKPPISLEQLDGQRTPSGYMLISDHSGRDVVAAIDLRNLKPSEAVNLEEHKQPLVVVPWCATMADTLRKLIARNRRVAAVVNELGETVGILTWEDMFEAILQLHNVRSHREFAKADVHPVAENEWVATGMTKLRKLERVIGRRINDTNNLTVGGIVQEQLHRLPGVGDGCQIDDLKFEVIEAGMRGEILVRITIAPPQAMQET